MIVNESRVASGRALIRYLFGPGKGVHEHTDQRVITAGVALGGEVVARGDLSVEAIGDLGEELDADEDVWQTTPAGGHIWHLAASLAPDDRHVSDDEFGEIAHTITEAIGFEREDAAPARWVAVAHGPNANGGQHIHIAGSLVRIDARRVNLWKSRWTLSRVCNEIEHAYGLRITEGRDRKRRPPEPDTEGDRGLGDSGGGDAPGLS